MKLCDLRVNNIAEPVGYAFESPVFSWTAEENSSALKQAELTISSGGKTVYESGPVSADSLGWQVDFPLKPRTRYDYVLTVTAEDGEQASAASFFETGKRQEAWRAKWISPVQSKTAALLDQTFCAEEDGKATRLYICGLGLYEVYINGEKAGKEYLAPGYHSYDFHLFADTCDISGLIRKGENRIVIFLNEGWFKGRLGFEGGYTDLYGDRLYAIAEIWQEDQLLAATDGSWRELVSPVTFANIYDGEIYDARIPWDQCVGFAEEAKPQNCGSLMDRMNLPVKAFDRFEVKEMIHTPKGDTVLDFGQNLTGWVVFSGHLPEGSKLTLTAGEILQDEEFYHENYRTARSEFTYISDGKERMVRPHFTFFGFRYMKLVCDTPVKAEDFTAVHLRSAMPVTASFECGSPLVSRLFENALWGLRDNLLEVPTDCPQRDERLGWTGDAQAVSETACQLLYMPAFFRKYLFDMRAEQSALEGSVPNVVPRIKKDMIGQSGFSPWADAGNIIGWNLWRFYGNRSLLKETYPGMKAWVDFQRAREEKLGGPHLVKDGFHFADWLALDNPEPGPFGATDPLYIASAYYYRCAAIVADAAGVLGLQEEKEYRDLSEEILASIREKYFDENSVCTIRTQTAAALAAAFGLTENMQAQGDVLDELVRENNSHLNTGFTGTPILCPALSLSGHHDTAVTLLLNEDFPSWLYSVKLGATTIWERWNSVLEDGHMNPEGMNSLNHYTYGSIASWMVSWLCGIRPAEPGYRKILLEPKPDRRLGYARCEMKTAVGTVLCGWKYEGDEIRVEVFVPFGAKAELHLPNQKSEILGPGSAEFCFKA